MNMTVKGAEALICGMARNHEGIHYQKCLADGCMMWRWSMTDFDTETVLQTGYCGLAGQPEGVK